MMDQDALVEGREPREKESKQRRSNVRTTTGYSRIVGKRRLPNGSHPNPKSADPLQKMSTISALADRFMSFMHGESADERKTRLRLHWYKGFLLSELANIERAVIHHSEHGNSLVAEFESQELQLQKWGLMHVLPAFRLQAWCRVSRSALVEEMAKLTLRIIKARYDRSLKVISMPEEVIAKNTAMSVLSLRLARTDRICAAYLNVFRSQLPELEPKSYEQRRLELAKILNDYQRVVSASLPGNLEESMSWDEFSHWYSNRQTELSRLEKSFASLVEDEREREGRLFRRWCTLALSDGNPDAQHMAGKKPVTSRSSLIGSPDVAANPQNVPSAIAMGGSASGVDRGSMFEANRQAYRAKDAADDRDTEKDFNFFNADVESEEAVFDGKSKMSPKSIIAFIKYFALRVVGARYAVKQFHTDTLIQLTEALVYRRISNKVYRYNSPITQEKDSTWRKKCYLCQFVDPTSYGVLTEYAFGPKPKSSVASAGNSAPVNGTSSSAELQSPEPSKDSSDPSSSAAVQQPSTNTSASVDDISLSLPNNSTSANVIDDTNADSVDDAEQERDDTFAMAPYTVCIPGSLGSGEDFSRIPRSVSIAEAREQLRSASTDQFRAIFSHMAFPPPKRSSSSGDGDGSAPDFGGIIGTSDQKDSGFEKLFDGPTFEPGDSGVETATTSEFISKYNKKTDEGADTPHVDTHPSKAGAGSSALVSSASAVAGSASSAASATIPSPKLSKFRASPNSKSSAAPSSNSSSSNSTATTTVLPLKKDNIPFSGQSSSNANFDDDSEFGDGLDSALISPTAAKKTSSLSSLDLAFDSGLSPLTSPGGEMDIISPTQAAREKESKQQAKQFKSQYSGTDRSSLAGATEADQQLYMEEEFRESVLIPRSKIPSSPSKASSVSDNESMRDVAPSSSSSQSNQKFHRSGSQHRNFCDGDASICSICKDVSLVGRLLSFPNQSSASSSSSSSTSTTPINYGKAYSRSVKLMGFISSCVTPREVIFNMLLALKWLLRDASDLAQKVECIGADVMFPILVLVLVHAKIPCMHLILHMLYQFGELDKYGEAEYYTTCLEAAITFIMRLDIPQDVLDAQAATIGKMGTVVVDDVGDASYVDKNHDESHAIAKLGEWLRDQQTMEDTITILQQEGWMV